MFESLLTVFVVLFPLFLIYKRVYFFPITFVRYNSNVYDVVSLKPNQFKSFFGGSYVSVRCSDSIVLIYSCSDTSVKTFESVSLPDCFLIAKVKRGRFVSISLSDREFTKVLSKIN